MTRLERARAKYHGRLSAATGAPQGAFAVECPRGATRGVVTGTDLDYDELLETAEEIGEQMLAVLLAGADPLMVLAGAWRAGVLVGVLYGMEENGA